MEEDRRRGKVAAVQIIGILNESTDFFQGICSMPTGASPLRINPTLPINLTRHARCRSAQRAIPVRVIEQLLATGMRDFDHQGGVRVHLHQQSAQQRFGELAGHDAAARYRNAYAVVDAADSTCVITVGWCELTRRTDPSPHRPPRR